MSHFRTIVIVTMLSVLTIFAAKKAVMHVIDQDLCTQCGDCVKNCPVEAIMVIKDGKKKKHVIDQDLCTQCGDCVKNCPVEAIIVSPVNK